MFPSPIIRIDPFSHKSKTTSSERKNFFAKIKGFLFEIWHKNEEMESACEDVTADLWVDDFDVVTFNVPNNLVSHI